MVQIGFLVNSDACSGCKTCQVACSDRHDLRAGMHWRRVFEVTSGGWQKKGSAWQTTVGAYYLSVACHHCAVPVCGASCPSEAIWKRDDGFVILDEARCTKCRKCALDCPYGAVRDDGSGNTPMSKCNGCVEEVDAGRPPVCVAACPNRALEFGEFDDLRKRPGSVNQVFPLPDPSITRPALAVLPHRRAASVAANGAVVANAEEL
ncbi:MAG: 4Fe-4S dicluster domain-containing protein [Bacteroidales bacterium]